MCFFATCPHSVLIPQSAEMQLKALQQQQEFFVIQYQELCKIQAAFASQKPDTSAASAEAKRRMEGLKTRRSQLERILSEEGSKILRTRKMLTNFYQECLNSVSIVQTVFVRGTTCIRFLLAFLKLDVYVEKLDKWKCAQCLGMINEEAQMRQLDCLQPECERLVELLWMLRQQLRQLSALQEQLFLKPDDPSTAGFSLPTPES